MEENTKVVSMNAENTEKKEQKKQLSYEELASVAKQLSEQNQILQNQLQQVNYVNFFKRMDYIFKVLEYAAMFDTKFVDSCVEEIQSALTVKEEENNTQKD